jgi:hypothetical protein
MSFIAAIIEIEEFTYRSIDELVEDCELINDISDSFYGYMDHPSEYSKLIFGTGPYNNNCNILYYRQFDTHDKDLEDEICESFTLVLSELKRNGYLFLFDTSQIELLINDDKGKFPNLDFESHCKFKSADF